MICPKCGKELENTDKFCGYCGAMLEAPAENNAEQSNVTSDKANQSNGMANTAEQVSKEAEKMEQQTETPKQQTETPKQEEQTISSDKDVKSVTKKKEKKEKKDKSASGKKENESATEGALKKKKKPWVKFVVIGGAVAVLGLATAGFMVMGGKDKINSRIMSSKAAGYLSNLDYDNAIATYRQAIKIDPDNVAAYIGLAQAYAAIEDYPSAIEVLDDGIRETGSEKLMDYREELVTLDTRICGYVYKVDTDLVENNNEVLPEATVEITGADGFAMEISADKNGYYDSGTIDAGEYTVTYRNGDDYVTCTQEYSVDDGRYVSNIYIEPLGYASMVGTVLVGDADTNYNDNYPLEDVDVTIEKINASNTYSDEIITDSNGMYQFDNLLMGLYQITFHKDGYIDINQQIAVYEGSEYAYNATVEMIPTEYEGIGTAEGMVYDAVTGYGVSGLTMNVRMGLNNTEGELIDSFTTGSDGYYTTPELDAGNYTIEIVDERSTGKHNSSNSNHNNSHNNSSHNNHNNGISNPFDDSNVIVEDAEEIYDDIYDDTSDDYTETEDKQYITTYINVKVLGGEVIYDQNATVSTTLASGQVRIVLSWGATPTDLDSHLLINLDNGYYNEVAYYTPSAIDDDNNKIADLDLDDTSSYGPETTTIYTPEAGNYTFFVYNYSGDAALSESGATVMVYMDGAVSPNYVFYVPAGEGYSWTVFSYDSRTGVLTPINEFYYPYEC